MSNLESVTLHGTIFHPKTGPLGPKLTTAHDPVLKQADSLVLSEDKSFIIVGSKGIEIQVPISNVAFFTIKK